MKEVEVVGAVIFHENKGYLCALRAEQMSQGGLWEFPGGKIEPGENRQQALIREIKEELGCLIEVGGHVASCTHDYERVRVHLHTFFAELVKGTPTAKEHAELRWVRREQLDELEWAPADIPTVQTIVSVSNHLT